MLVNRGYMFPLRSITLHILCFSFLGHCALAMVWKLIKYYNSSDILIEWFLNVIIYSLYLLSLDLDVISLNQRSPLNWWQIQPEKKLCLILKVERQEPRLCCPLLKETCSWGVTGRKTHLRPPSGFSWPPSAGCGLHCGRNELFSSWSGSRCRGCRRPTKTSSTLSHGFNIESVSSVLVCLQPSAPAPVISNNRVNYDRSPHS